MPVTILISGFGPFPGAPFNPTAALATSLARRRRPAFADARRIPHVFRTSYKAIESELPALVSRYRPTALLMFGLANRTKHVRIETRARNCISQVFPDADGHKPARLELTRGAPSLKPVRVPRADLLHAARNSGIPARISCDTGRYLCNALFWRGLEASDRQGGPSIVAFVHVPQLARHVNPDKLRRAGEEILLAVLAAARRPR